MMGPWCVFQEIAAILATLVERGVRIEGDLLALVKPLLPENVQGLLPGPLQDRLAASGADPAAPVLGASSALPAPPAAAPSMEDTIANRTSMALPQPASQPSGQSSSAGLSSCGWGSSKTHCLQFLKLHGLVCRVMAHSALSCACGYRLLQLPE